MGLELAGKHRGIVVDNIDPEKLGRLKVRVEAAYGEQPVENLPWAWPCFLGGGSPDCGFFYVPEKGACVWVEFLWNNGEPDPTSPVWTGVWFPKGGTPAEVEGPPEDAHYYKVIKTPSKHAITLCDKPGKEFIRIRHGVMKQVILMDKEGNIYITAVKRIYEYAPDGIRTGVSGAGSIARQGETRLGAEHVTETGVYRPPSDNTDEPWAGEEDW